VIEIFVFFIQCGLNQDFWRTRTRLLWEWSLGAHGTKSSWKWARPLHAFNNVYYVWM